MQVTDDLVEQVYNAYSNLLGQSESCDRCKGYGYHHGFGEHGHDPDWCDTCGGCGMVPKHDEMSAMKEALTMAIASQDGKR